MMVMVLNIYACICMFGTIFALGGHGCLLRGEGKPSCDCSDGPRSRGPRPAPAAGA